MSNPVEVNAKVLHEAHVYASMHLLARADRKPISSLVRDQDFCVHSLSGDEPRTGCASDRGKYTASRTVDATSNLFTIQARPWL